MPLFLVERIFLILVLLLTNNYGNDSMFSLFLDNRLILIVCFLCLSRLCALFSFSCFSLSSVSFRFSVQICVGIHEICTKPVKFEHGTCRWGEWLKADRISLPEDPDQLPDIFIYLLREDNKPVCFYRLKPFRDVKTKELMGFDRPAEWVLLQEDKSIDALEKGLFVCWCLFLLVSFLSVLFILLTVLLSFSLFLSPFSPIPSPFAFLYFRCFPWNCSGKIRFWLYNRSRYFL
jgi:hypothetical protein